MFENIMTRRGLLFGEFSGATTHIVPECTQRRLAGTVVQQRPDPIHEVVAAGSVHLPVVGKPLSRAKDLLDDKPGPTARCIRWSPACQFAEPCTQPTAIGRRIGQSVDMVDPYAVDQP